MTCTHTSWAYKSRCGNCGARRPEEVYVPFKAPRETCQHEAGRTGAVEVCGEVVTACVRCGL